VCAFHSCERRISKSVNCQVIMPFCCQYMSAQYKLWLLHNNHCRTSCYANPAHSWMIIKAFCFEVKVFSLFLTCSSNKLLFSIGTVEVISSFVIFWVLEYFHRFEGQVLFFTRYEWIRYFVGSRKQVVLSYVQWRRSNFMGYSLIVKF